MLFLYGLQYVPTNTTIRTTRLITEKIIFPQRCFPFIHSNVISANNTNTETKLIYFGMAKKQKSIYIMPTARKDIMISDITIIFFICCFPRLSIKFYFNLFPNKISYTKSICSSTHSVLTFPSHRYGSTDTYFAFSGRNNW